MANLVVLDISLSLDGYMRGPHPRPDAVLGEGGERLHAWARSEATDADLHLLTEAIGGAGAIICGRRTFNDSLAGWRADGPTGPARLPVFVVSHSTPNELPVNGVYRFAPGIEAALTAARAAAGGKDVCIMGGADIGRQFLHSGLVDELSLHLAPVLLGGGTPMFGEHSPALGVLTLKSAITTPAATHLRYALGR